MISALHGPRLWMLLIAAATVWAGYAIARTSDDPAWIHLANATGPAVLGLTCLGAGYWAVRKDPLVVWTPLPWFLATWAIYYGLGPLAYVYATPETVAHMDAVYPVDATALLRTNVLNLVGLVAVLVGAWAAAKIRLGRARLDTRVVSHDPWRVALIFLTIGVPIKYLFELPFQLGLTDFVLPGMVIFLGSFSSLAIIPLSVAAAQGRRAARALLPTLVVSELAVGLVMLYKLYIIMPILLAFLGRFAVRPDVRRLLLGGLFIAFAYVAVLSPFVNFARMMIGRTSAQNVGETVAAIDAYRAGGREILADISPGVQMWWSRVSYPSAQAFAMDQFDQGRPGWTFGMALYIFLPRLIAPDKPIMMPGRDFTYLMVGTDTSSSGPGTMIGEAYWNGGWPAAIATGLFLGVLYVGLGRVSMRAIRARRWLLMPLIFMTIYVGLRPDEWFIPMVASVLQTVIVVGLLLLAFSKYVGVTRRNPPVTAFLSTSEKLVKSRA